MPEELGLRVNGLGFGVKVRRFWVEKFGGYVQAVFSWLRVKGSGCRV